MPKITYVEFNGTEHAVEVPVGWSLMEGAVKNGVAGIIADCGGACACATCHVYLDRSWGHLTKPPSPIELSMLDLAMEPTEESRLSCQVRVVADMDGKTVRLPEVQG